MEPTPEQLRALWDACVKWRDEHKPWEPGDAWAVCEEDSDVATTGLLETVCEVIGYCPCPPVNLRLVVRDAFGAEVDLTVRGNLCRGMRFGCAHSPTYTWTPESDWTPDKYNDWCGMDPALASAEDMARFGKAVQVR